MGASFQTLKLAVENRAWVVELDCIEQEVAEACYTCTDHCFDYNQR